MAAARALKVARVTLDEPDGRLQNTLEAQWKLIRIIRRFRPRALFTHHFSEEHPDHGNAARIVVEAAFRAGLSKLDCEGTPWRPKRIFHAVDSSSVTPSFCVDISAHWEEKLRVLRCYESQFHNPKAGKYKGRTDLARPPFLEALEIRARFWGLRIKRRYAEAFWCGELAEVNDPTALGEERFPSALRLASTALSTGRSGTSRRRP
jgi:LmbE family N-acetylglucosaminyl deacetylase